MHPRNRDGIETFDPGAVREAIEAVRAAAPGMRIGLSTHVGIEADPANRRRAFAAWRVKPDYVSVNFSEGDAGEVTAQMADLGIGVEAGLASMDDARRFLASPPPATLVRVLIEIEEQEENAAVALARAMVEFTRKAGPGVPIQLHGFDASKWPLYREALWLGLERRIGLEDGRLLPDGGAPRDNAALIAAAVALAEGINQSAMDA
jgi:uncharacterized protein (DUF849 family)